MCMQKKHTEPYTARIPIGKPFEDAIDMFLLPKTNNGNLSGKWNRTDWTRYALAQEIAKRNNGKIPKACKDMLKEFTADLDMQHHVQSV